jgi:hypothetical protein
VTSSFRNRDLHGANETPEHALRKPQLFPLDIREGGVGIGSF